MTQWHRVITGLSEQRVHHDELELKAAGVIPDIIHHLVQDKLLIPRENIHLTAAVGQGSYLITSWIIKKELWETCTVLWWAVTNFLMCLVCCMNFVVHRSIWYSVQCNSQWVGREYKRSSGSENTKRYERETPLAVITFSFFHILHLHNYKSFCVNIIH